jgi:hypothetical protein
MLYDIDQVRRLNKLYLFISGSLRRHLPSDGRDSTNQAVRVAADGAANVMRVSFLSMSLCCSQGSPLLAVQALRYYPRQCFER